MPQYYVHFLNSLFAKDRLGGGAPDKNVSFRYPSPSTEGRTKAIDVAPQRLEEYWGMSNAMIDDVGIADYVNDTFVFNVKDWGDNKPFACAAAPYSMDMAWQRLHSGNNPAAAPQTI